MGHREAFEKYIKSNFLSRKNAGSKTMTRSKGDRVVRFLTARCEDEDAHFKHWVKTREFRLMDYPALGLRNILCVPAKAKVSTARKFYLKHSRLPTAFFSG